MLSNIISVLLKDGYKVGHPFQYPKGTNRIYSNMTPRSSRVVDPETGKPADKVVVFGPQYLSKEYLLEHFNFHFFGISKKDVLRLYKRRIDNYLGKDAITFDHIEALWSLGYLPLEVKALPEGTLCPLRVPYLTIQNTHPDFGWLTNSLETLMSNVLWLPITSATTAFGYRQRFESFAKKTGSNLAFVPWQGHDFSMRGMSGLEAAMLSGAAHLLSFTGTDTIPAIDFLEKFYGADCERELVGGSVPATEHSVMCMGLKEGEFETFRRLITETYPRGIVSIVSDTWDFWTVLTDYLPRLRSEILSRDGKVVIRPDSGDPVKIICGDPDAPVGSPARLGAIRLLYNTFGGTKNAAGFIELDPHIGLIYGDSITPERQYEILRRLASMGLASSNVVLGVGSFTYQYVTRDTYGQAMKATYGEVNGKGQAISKNPATDSGTKRSASGLLRVDQGEDGNLILKENCSEEEEKGGLLHTIFKDGKLYNPQTLSGIRKRLESYL